MIEDSITELRKGDAKFETTKIPIALITGIVPFCWCCPILFECTEKDNPMLDAWGERRKYVDLKKANCARDHGWR